MRTIFNFLGPLTNPAGAERQVIGVSDPRFLETIAARSASSAPSRALVVSSDDGLDEFTRLGDTRVVELKDGQLDELRRSPRSRWGSSAAADGAVGAGTPDENARVLRARARRASPAPSAR